MIHILVAMEREAEALALPCTVIGIGASNLPIISHSDIIVNVGYCGGDRIPVGSVVEPIVTIDADSWWVDTLTPHFEGVPKVPCISSSDFVAEPLVTGPAVYDMELSALAGINCAGLYVLKIVSDHLCEKDCEKYHDPAAWEKIRELLRNANLIPEVIE